MHSKEKNTLMNISNFKVTIFVRSKIENILYESVYVGIYLWPYNGCLNENLAGVTFSLSREKNQDGFTFATQVFEIDVRSISFNTKEEKSTSKLLKTSRFSYLCWSCEKFVQKLSIMK